MAFMIEVLHRGLHLMINIVYEVNAVYMPCLSNALVYNTIQINIGTKYAVLRTIICIVANFIAVSQCLAVYGKTVGTNGRKLKKNAAWNSPCCVWRRAVELKTIVSCRS